MNWRNELEYRQGYNGAAGAANRLRSLRARQQQLEAACGPVRITHEAPLCLARELIAPVSSRLGQDASLIGDVCQRLARVALDCRASGAAMLVATGTAIAPFALRASELFGVPLFHLVAEQWPRDNARHISVALKTGGKVSRDMAVVCLADRVHALYVRRGGTLESCLLHRLQARRDATTRVSVTAHRRCAGSRLVAAGAVGSYFGSAGGEPEQRSFEATHSKDGKDRCTDEPLESGSQSTDWMFESDQWLIHCTRGRVSAWPGQTERQHVDSLLLKGDSLGDDWATPLASLRRIVRCGRLLGSCVATERSTPVVCFSALPLADLLSKRSYRSHLRRWDYEPYGLAIRKEVAVKVGVKPVIYGDTNRREQLPAADRYRLQSPGKTHDWTSEREWRTAGNFNFDALPKDAVRVFVPSVDELQAIQAYSLWPISVVPSDVLSRARYTISEVSPQDPFGVMESRVLYCEPRRWVQVSS